MEWQVTVKRDTVQLPLGPQVGGRGLGTHAQGPSTCQLSVSAEGRPLIQGGPAWLLVTSHARRLPVPESPEAASSSVFTSLPQLHPMVLWMPWMISSG